MPNEYILDGVPYGETAEGLMALGGHYGLRRPYIDEDGVRCADFQGKKVPIRELIANGVDSPVFNSTSLRKDEWIRYDQKLIGIARKRLRFWGDLASTNLMTGFDGMSVALLEHETVSDPGSAVVDMDVTADVEQDSPRFQLEGIPLPITQAGFSFGARRLAISRRSGTPLSTRSLEACARRVAESVEKTAIGMITGLTYGNSSDYGRTPTVYGATNFPSRITKTDLNAPTGANGTTVLSDWLAMRELLYDANQYGPFIAYVSNDWDQYLDNLFSTSEPSAGTLRSRLLQIDGLNAIRRLDYLTNTFTVLMIQMSSETVEAIEGLPLRVTQWESNGGSVLHFKVTTIMVPRFFADQDGQCGICHGTTS